MSGCLSSFCPTLKIYDSHLLLRASRKTWRWVQCMGGVSSLLIYNWEDITYRLLRARATSAAPSFFKPFRSERSRRCYLDGALFHNNPVRVADLKRRLIWPNSKSSPPGILLSVGTSCNSATRREAQKYQKSDRISTTSDPGGAQENVFQKVQKTTQMGKVIKIMKNRVENILDTEIRWLKLCQMPTQRC